MPSKKLKQFHRVTKPAYIIDLDVAGPGLRPDQNVPAANDLYRKAMTFKGKGLGSEYTDNQIRAELFAAARRGSTRSRPRDRRRRSR